MGLGGRDVTDLVVWNGRTGGYGWGPWKARGGVYRGLAPLFGYTKGRRGILNDAEQRAVANLWVYKGTEADRRLVETAAKRWGFRP
jgi:hypothetical protein